MREHTEQVACLSKVNFEQGMEKMILEELIADLGFIQPGQIICGRVHIVT